jgi:SAM-dependent methyltransferase
MNSDGGALMTALNAELATTWVRRWDAQQELYVADREERFAVIGGIVAHALGDSGGTVVDLGCGPGSLAGRLAGWLPRARVIGVDSDPLLLAMAAGRYGDAVEFVDADLADPGWFASVPDVLAAAVSSTALHWLGPAALADLYKGLAGRLRPGGVFVDGDHLPVGDPVVDEIAVRVRQGRAERAGVTENEDWDAWWAAVGQEPALAGLISKRSVEHHGSNRLSAGQHREMLLAAGFSNAGTVWQSGDDQVLVAVR